MAIGRQVMSSLRWIAVARFSAQAITWTITILVMRILSPEDFGLMALAMVPIGLIGVLDEMGLGSALVQRRDVDRTLQRQVLGALLSFSLAVYVVVFALAPLVSGVYGNARLTPIIRVLAIRLPFMSLAIVPESALRRAMSFRRKSVVEFTAMATNSVLTLGAAIGGLGVWSLVLGSIAGGAVRALGMTIAARLWILPRFDFRGLGGVAGFGSLVTANRVLWYLYSQADVLIIGKLLGEVVLGYYAVAMQLATLPMTKIAGILNEVGFSAYSRVRNEGGNIAEHFRKALRVVSFFAFPVFLGISSISPEIVGVFLDERWYPATVPLAVLSFVVPLRMLATMLPPALFGLGRPGVSMGNQVVACIVMPAAFILAARGGLDAVALAWLVAYPPLFAIILHRSLPVIGVSFRDYMSEVRVAGLASLVMFGAVFGVRLLIRDVSMFGGVRLGILVAAGVLAYGAVMMAGQRGYVREVTELVRR